MQSLISVLAGKRFSILVGGEFERRTNFLGLMKLLAHYSDFFNYTEREQLAYLSKFVTYKVAVVDSNITVKFK